MRNDYNKDMFWSCKNEETEVLKYFIKLNGTMIEVSCDVYRVCFNSYRKSLRDNRSEENNPVISLDAFADSGHLFQEIILDKSIEENKYELEVQNYVVLIKDYINQNYSETDREIICKYLFDQKSCTHIAKDLGMPKSTVIYHIYRNCKSIIRPPPFSTQNAITKCRKWRTRK